MALNKNLNQIDRSMASEKSELQLRQTLDKRLYLLQGESAAVQAIELKTRQREYENLAAIYIWWRAALGINGYLEKALEPTKVRRVFNDVNDGTNFRRLLYLMYGNYGLGKDHLERKNFVICCLHKEFEKNSELYSKDTVNKLAGFIASRGGVDGLKDQRPESKNSVLSAPTKTESKIKPSFSAATKNSVQVPVVEAAQPTTSNSQKPVTTYRPRIEVKITDRMRQAALRDEAEAYFARSTVAQQITIRPPIEANKEGYALLMVKRNGAAYDLISTGDGVEAMRELLVNSYRKQYQALPASIRCFFEIIKTQSLPSNLQKFYDRLGELSVEKHEDKTRRKITRRLMYISSKNMLVLSPTYSRSGVVTTAKLHTSPFENGASDCFMPTRCRKLVEQRMIATNDFNLYSPSNPEVVPAFKREGLASHMARLDSKADRGDFVFLEFWNFETEMGDATKQLIIAPSYVDSCRTRFQVSRDDVKTFVIDHIDQWLDSYGDYITRPAHQLIGLSVTRNGFELGFDYVNGVFRNKVTSAFVSSQPPANFSATFLAKDLCLALHSIGSLPLTTEIEMAFSNDALFLIFSTSVADYTVAIPTTKGVRRNENAFSVYEGVIKENSEWSSDTDEADDNDLIEFAAQQANVVISDIEIEKLIADEIDDYSEILEGWLPQPYESIDVDAIEWVVTESDQ